MPDGSSPSYWQFFLQKQVAELLPEPRRSNLAAYAPLYDATGNLVAITGPDGKPIERYTYSPYGERKILVDLTPSRIELVRKEGQEIWVEVSEEVLGAVLEAEEGESLRLINTVTSLPVIFSVSQPFTG